jgi:hypothetical protein
VEKNEEGRSVRSRPFLAGVSEEKLLRCALHGNVIQDYAFKESDGLRFHLSAYGRQQIDQANMDLTLLRHKKMTILRSRKIEHFQPGNAKKLSSLYKRHEVGRSLAAAAKCDARPDSLSNEPHLLDLENYLSLLRDLHNSTLDSRKFLRSHSRKTIAQRNAAEHHIAIAVMHTMKLALPCEMV